jgi:hypothetical protein
MKHCKTYQFQNQLDSKIEEPEPKKKKETLERFLQKN